jgi:hypothetical protein
MALQALTSKPKVKIRIALPYPQSNTSKRLSRLLVRFIMRLLVCSPKLLGSVSNRLLVFFCTSWCPWALTSKCTVLIKCRFTANMAPFLVEEVSFSGGWVAAFGGHLAARWWRGLSCPLLRLRRVLHHPRRHWSLQAKVSAATLFACCYCPSH